MLTRLEITETKPFAGGLEFGAVGPYLLISGKAHGLLDPESPLNAVIVNLARAPRNPGDLVEYDADFEILTPVAAAASRRRLIFEVTNRGRRPLFPIILGAPDPSTEEPLTAENRFAFESGYVLAWSGWDPLLQNQNGLSIRVPTIEEDGQTITQIREEFVFGTRLEPHSLTARLSQPVADADQRLARLTVRAKERDSRSVIPAREWEYLDPQSFRLLPPGREFQSGLIYEFWYPATAPKVLGIGFAATRDLVSFLRYETRDRFDTVNPLHTTPDSRPAIDKVLAFGFSQGGRYLRQHVYDGFNQDESHRKVFDGILTHAAGSGKLFANSEFAQPFRTVTQHEDHRFPENQFPFAYSRMTDPTSGTIDSLMRDDGFDPLVIEVNTSTEYWQKGASLVHTDPLGTRDLPDPPSVRNFLIAGTQHGGRPGMMPAPTGAIHPRNLHDPSPVLRALLAALDGWVTVGEDPPMSQAPSIGKGTLVRPGDLAFPILPWAEPPQITNEVGAWNNWVNPDPLERSEYQVLVPQVDDDGNEIDGVRLPAISVPLGSHTGWNLYAAPELKGELYDREGSFLPFARTRAERLAAADPRPALEERYPTIDIYMAAVEAAINDLTARGLILPGESDRLTEEARRNFEAAHASVS